MSTSTPTSSLTVRKLLSCPPEYAYRAWTDPKMFNKWFLPHPQGSMNATMDVRIGGKYEIVFRHGCEGEHTAVTVTGEFLVIDPPRRLEYTWVWESEADPNWTGDTVVKIDFNAVGREQTELVLTHERFTNDEDRDAHAKGWTRILDAMALAMDQRGS